MKRLLILLTLASLCLAACGRPHTPAAEPTTHSVVTATETAQPTASSTEASTATPAAQHCRLPQGLLAQWPHRPSHPPTALLYVRPNEERPYTGRGIEIHDWDTGRVVARSMYDGDVMGLLWSTDGQRVGAQIATGLIVVWPIRNEKEE